MSYSTISARQIPTLLESGARVIDVRTAAEFRSAHVAGAELQPLDQLDPTAFSGRPVYILCQSGKRASMAAHKFTEHGHRHIYVIEGGTDAAIEAGLTIVRGKHTISIERQVRIAAGALVLIGTLLGLFVHGGLFAIPAFIGAGLLFAGATDSCGMGMMLSKCPWNR
ncbi:MAG: rhodanese-like domain-containing protein [Opitutales bacterium]